MENNKELEIALTTYIALKHSQEECSGFIDGFKEAKALQLLQTDVSKCVYCNNKPYKKGAAYCERHMASDDYS